MREQLLRSFVGRRRGRGALTVCPPPSESRALLRSLFGSSRGADSFNRRFVTARQQLVRPPQNLLSRCHPPETTSAKKRAKRQARARASASSSYMCRSTRTREKSIEPGGKEGGGERRLPLPPNIVLSGPPRAVSANDSHNGGTGDSGSGRGGGGQGRRGGCSRRNMTTTTASLQTLKAPRSPQLWPVQRLRKLQGALR